MSSLPTKVKSAPPTRGEPLPQAFPKPAQDDPDAIARVAALLKSPSYVRADRDPAFLDRDELRATRLELEYLKVELELRRQKIEKTIVLFGGTRIVEPAAAARSVAELEAALQRDPENSSLRRRLDITNRVREKSKFYAVAREFSSLVSRLNLGLAREDRWIIATGGGPGIMEAGNRGAFDVGCRSIGMNITLPLEQYPNPYISPDLCFQFRYFALRKFHFMQRAKALVAFPGGYGTLDEIFDALCLVQTRKIAPIPIVLVGERFWRRALDAEFLSEEGVIAPEDMELFCYAETAEEIWDNIGAFWQNPGST